MQTPDKRTEHPVPTLRQPMPPQLPETTPGMKTDRAYQVLAAGNEAVLRAEDESQLFRSVLDILINLNGYALGWIGRACHDEERNLEVLSWCGEKQDYLNELRVRWQHDRFSQGPGGIAVKTRRPVVCQDVETDQNFLPWLSLAQVHGIHSAVAIPLLFGENDVGLPRPEFGAEKSRGQEDDGIQAPTPEQEVGDGAE